MDKQLAFAEFWTIEEVAEYIIRTVDRRAPLDEEIVKEWNELLANITERRNE